MRIVKDIGLGAISYSIIGGLISLVQLTLGIALTAPVSIALAQSRYSVDGANQYACAKDWNGLGRYASAWTKAEPNKVKGRGQPDPYLR